MSTPADELARLIFELEVAATTFETVQSKEYREGMFNAAHGKLLRKTAAALRQRPSDTIRNAVIEECAKVADAWEGSMHTRQIAQAIRALAQANHIKGQDNAG